MTAAKPKTPSKVYLNSQFNMWETCATSSPNQPSTHKVSYPLFNLFYRPSEAVCLCLHANVPQEKIKELKDYGLGNFLTSRYGLEVTLYNWKNRAPKYPAPLTTNFLTLFGKRQFNITKTIINLYSRDSKLWLKCDRLWRCGQSPTRVPCD